MSSQKFTEAHHQDKTSKWIAWLLVVIVFLASAIGLSWNESSKAEKKIIKAEAIVDSLSHEIEWRQKVLTHHDSLQSLVADAQNFRKLPYGTRQEVTAELEKSTPKIQTTKHNIEVLEKLLNIELENLTKLQENVLYKIYH